MSDVKKTKEQLVEELAETRARIAALEVSGAGHERRVAELAVVNEIGQAISSTTELDDLVKTVQQQVSRLFDTTGFHMATYEEESDKWILVFARDRSQLHKPRKLGVGLSGYIIRNRRHLLFYSSEEMDAFQKAQGIEDVGSRSHSWMGVPLMVADKVVGVMGIQSYEHENLYDEQDLTLFSTVAAQVAPALNNLRLLEETRRRVQQMRVINEVGQAITSVLDPDIVLQQIVDTTKEHFGQYHVCIVLVEGEHLILQSGSTVGNSDVRLGFALKDINLRHGPSLVTEAARTGQPVLTNDVLNDPRYFASEELPDTRSELCLPIKVEGRVIGVLDVQSDQLFAYDQTDVNILQSLANQAGVAIENAHLFKEARVRAEELAVLNELGQALTTRLDVEKVVEEAYQGTARLLDTTNFYVALYDPKTDSISFPLSFEKGQRVEWESRQARQGLTEYVIHNQQPLLIHEHVDEQLKKIGIESIGETALSWLGVPLMISGRVLGVVTIQSYTTPGLYDEHALDLLSAIANQTAIALQNAQMFEETQRRVREMQLLHDVSLVAASGVRLEETLQATAKALATEFEGALVALMLLDQESNTLCLTTGVGYPPGVVGHERIPVGEGITGWVIEHREPALVPDTSLDPRCIDFERVDFVTRSELCVPLVADSRVIGVINLEHVQINAFTNDDQRLLSTLTSNLAMLVERARLFDNMEQMVGDRTRELRESLEERERLQQEIIIAQKLAIQELSTPIIPVMEGIIVMPLIGSIDTMRARDIMRTLLAGIREQRAKVVILDITGVPIVDSGVANHLNKTIQAARLKGARTIVTGISDAVAETIVDLGIDWSGIETLTDLRTGLVVALHSMGIKLSK